MNHSFIKIKLGKIIPIYLLTVTICSSLYAQINKNILSTSSITNFPTLLYSNFTVSNDGQYLIYENASTWGQKKGGITLKNVNSNWEKVLYDIKGWPIISLDSKYTFTTNKNNELLIIKNGENHPEYIYGVDSYEIITDKKKNSFY